MISKFVKHLFFLMLLGCTTTTTSLQEKEASLVGNWIAPVDNGQVQGMYMEFNDDRTGVIGPAINFNGEVGILPIMSFLIVDWRLQNDTLLIQHKMRSGYAANGPNGKEVKKSDKPSFSSYVVWEISETEIVLENLIGEFPGMKDIFIKSEKLELFSD